MLPTVMPSFLCICVDSDRNDPHEDGHPHQNDKDKHGGQEDQHSRDHIVEKE